MTKPLMKYVPQKYYSSIRNFYKDSEGYWLCLKADGDYIFENYFSEYTIHENTINEVMTAFRKSIPLRMMQQRQMQCLNALQPSKISSSLFSKTLKRKKIKWKITQIWVIFFV